MPESLSLAEARRASLAAQGMPRRRRARPTSKTVLDVVKRQGVLQVDSVNVLARAHYMPLFSRLGPYDVALLDRLAYRDRQLFEAWSHVASLLPIELWPHHEFRRVTHRQDWEKYMTPERVAYFKNVLTEVTERGPMSAGELSDTGRKKSGPWFERSGGKQAMEFLFGTGALAIADRRGFERVYDLTDRVIPAEVLRAPVPSEDDARRELLLRAAAALGVATIDDLAFYYGHKLTPTKRIIKELVAGGELVEVRVEGWNGPAFARPDLRVPRQLVGHGIVNPFDPVVWSRPRTARLFGFDYIIEIYVPAPKRVHGYYVLPFLLGDRLVARVDLKADRKARVLRVFSAWREKQARVDDVAVALAEELALVAAWLGLDTIEVQRKGDLARQLAAAVRMF